MAQIIVKENEKGRRQLFDTRSEKFISGGCVNTEETELALLEVANSVARRAQRTIVEMATDWQYRDNGYTESMIAKAYLDINPDIRIKVLEKARAEKDEITAKIDKRTVRKGKKGKRATDIVTKVRKEKVIVTSVDTSKRDIEVQVSPGSIKGEIDWPLSDIPRKRGRPRKIVSEVVKEDVGRKNTQTAAEKPKRGRPVGSKNRPK